MILVDSNVLMYASGAEHRNKHLALRFLNRVAAGEVEATVDAGGAARDHLPLPGPRSLA